MRQLLEAGVHFGHQSHRWNPKMGEYIFGTRNNIHIIDLAQTVPMLHRALQAVSDTVAKGGRILFVGTKRQAQDAVADAAKRCAAVLRQLALARRHADQLEDDLRIDQAAAQARRDAGLGRGARLHQEGAPDAAARARQARPRARRHQGHGRPARPPVRDRHQQGRHRDQGGAAPRHPGRRRGRHQLRSGRHHLPGAGQRRRRPRHHALLRSDLARRDRRHLARPGRGRHRCRRGRPSRSWRSCRRRPRGRPASSRCPGPRGVADDLKKLAGVSPAIEKKLNDLGIFHYWQIAELGPRRCPQDRRRGRAARPRSTAGSPRPRSSAPSEPARNFLPDAGRDWDRLGESPIWASMPSSPARPGSDIALRTDCRGSTWRTSPPRW